MLQLHLQQIESSEEAVRKSTRNDRDGFRVNGHPWDSPAALAAVNAAAGDDAWLG